MCSSYEVAQPQPNTGQERGTHGPRTLPISEDDPVDEDVKVEIKNRGNDNAKYEDVSDILVVYFELSQP